MSNIEPTEEQREAVRAFINDPSPQGWLEDRIARLLAEREAKLRDEVVFMKAGARADYNAFAEALQKEDAYLAEINLINERLAEMRAVDLQKSRMLYDRDVVIDTLRARVAELEQQRNKAESQLMKARSVASRRGSDYEAREAQHLADIKALKDALETVERGCEFVRTRDGELTHALVRIEAFGALGPARQRLAHYDDAKADAPASTEGGDT